MLASVLILAHLIFGTGDSARVPDAMLSITPFSRALYLDPVKYRKAHTAFVKATRGTDGNWTCAYSGHTLPHDSISVDHIIPLKYAHTHGMSRHGVKSRTDFGSDTLNFALVSVRLNSSKGDEGPQDFMPAMNACLYARRWFLVGKKYGIRFEPSDSTVLTRTLAGCK